MKFEFEMYRDFGNGEKTVYADGLIECQEKAAKTVKAKLSAGLRGNWKIGFSEVKRGRPAASKPADVAQTAPPANPVKKEEK